MDRDEVSTTRLLVVVPGSSNTLCVCFGKAGKTQSMRGERRVNRMAMKKSERKATLGTVRFCSKTLERREAVLGMQAMQQQRKQPPHQHVVVNVL